MKRFFLTFRCMLLISILFLGIGINISQTQAESTENKYLYLYREEIKTILLREKETDTTADLADGYKPVSYEYVKNLGRIQHVIIGDDVSSIDNDTMPYWLNCISVTVGDGITILPEKLFCPNEEGLFFEICSPLETISLGKSVKTIGDYAFYRCKSLKNITVDPDNPYLKIEQKGLYSKDGKKLYAYPVAADGEPVIADDTQKISPAVFAFSHVTNMEIPASVEALSSGLFEECTSLKKLSFAENSNCIRTKSTNTWSGDKYDRSMFWKCTSLQEVRFGEKFQHLAADTFENSALRSVYFGKAFRGITDNHTYGKVFYNLDSGDSIFPNLEKIEVSKQNKKFMVKNAALLSRDGKILYFYPTARKNKSYTVPASVNTIRKGAFYKNKYLQKVHTGKNTTTIESSAFDGSIKLTKVYLGRKTNLIQSEAFRSCARLSKIVNLEKVKKLRIYALDGTKIMYVPDWAAHEYSQMEVPPGKIAYLYAKNNKQKATWRITKGKNCIKILKRYKNSTRIKVKFKKKGYIGIQVKQGNAKTKCSVCVIPS